MTIRDNQVQRARSRLLQLKQEAAADNAAARILRGQPRAGDAERATPGFLDDGWHGLSVRRQQRRRETRECRRVIAEYERQQAAAAERAERQAIAADRREALAENRAARRAATAAERVELARVVAIADAVRATARETARRRRAISLAAQFVERMPDLGYARSWWSSRASRCRRLQSDLSEWARGIEHEELRIHLRALAGLAESGSLDTLTAELERLGMLERR